MLAGFGLHPHRDKIRPAVQPLLGSTTMSLSGSMECFLFDVSWLNVKRQGLSSEPVDEALGSRLTICTGEAMPTNKDHHSYDSSDY